jgi:nucleotide-binding universal stress UspA family protein
MFRRILVPIDGSPTSQLGLREAIKLAQDQGATLCLLHVIDDETIRKRGSIYAHTAYIDEFLAALRKGGEKILTEAEKEVKKHAIKCWTALLETMDRPVPDAIIEQARKWRADLIVLGTHGRRGLSRLVMGSAAEGVVRAAHAPVLLVRHPGTAPQRRLRAIRNSP